MDRLTVRLGSGNENKLRELARARCPAGSSSCSGADEYPAEGGDSYYENARAQGALRAEVGPAEAWVLGEDSGLEVAALGGAPGRPLGALAPRAEKRSRGCSRSSTGVEGEGRRARYVCELVALAPDGEEHRGTGVLEGRIAERAARQRRASASTRSSSRTARTDRGRARQRLEARQLAPREPRAACEPRPSDSHSDCHCSAVLGQAGGFFDLGGRPPVRRGVATS